MKKSRGELTHLDAQGRARMVDVGDKAITRRVCIARGVVRMQRATLARIVEGRIAKGDVLATARIAGIQAAKRTAEWIPLAHPMPLDAIEVVLEPGAEGDSLAIEARVQAHWRTGVEMEALVAVAAAGLTVYDMCKAVDRGMQVDRVRLVAKQGGKSGSFVRAGEVGIVLESAQTGGRPGTKGAPGPKGISGAGGAQGSGGRAGARRGSQGAAAQSRGAGAKAARSRRKTR